MMGLDNLDELFSYHLVRLSFRDSLSLLLSPLHNRNIKGLKHSESLLKMQLGKPVVSPSRYDFRTISIFAYWSDEDSINQFLTTELGRKLDQGWHVRMRPYRTWGEVSDLASAHIFSKPEQLGPVVAVTLARLRVSQGLRFARWGHPVEKQVRDHDGKTLALASMRPLNTFSTFSIWQNETEMINMVRGRSEQKDGKQHISAMKERERKPFHRQFMTIRFYPMSESGSWDGRSNYIS